MWTNWSGGQRCRPVATARPLDEAGVAGVVRRAAERGQTVRPVGSGHGFSDLAVTEGVHLDASAFSGITAGAPRPGGDQAPCASAAARPSETSRRRSTTAVSRSPSPSTYVTPRSAGPSRSGSTAAPPDAGRSPTRSSGCAWSTAGAGSATSPAPISTPPVRPSGARGRPRRRARRRPRGPGAGHALAEGRSTRSSTPSSGRPTSSRRRPSSPAPRPPSRAGASSATRRTPATRSRRPNRARANRASPASAPSGSPVPGPPGGPRWAARSSSNAPCPASPPR